jgi:uncharacterized membrane protein YfcA
MVSHRVKCAVAGGLAGIANGFFGGGGGMILVPLLTRWIGLPAQKSFATSVAVILPLCVVSAAIYLLRTPFSILDAIPYLVGGLIGGFLGGKWFRSVPVQWLRRGFGLFLLYGGVKSLFF